jgi:hypothetical protein
MDSAAGSHFGPKVLVERRRVAWPLACAFVVAACGLCALTVGLHGLSHGAINSSTVPLLGGLAALVAGKLAAAVLWIVKPTSRRKVSVEAEAGQMIVAGSAMPATGAVASAAPGGGWHVDVYDGARLPAAVFLVASSDEATALATAATPAVGDGPVTFSLPFYQSKVGTFVAGAGSLASFLLLGLLGKSAWAWPVAFVSIACAAMMLVPLRLTIGRDAIRFAWLRFRRYVALADVADVSVQQGRLVLRLRTGGTFFLGVREREIGGVESNSAATAARIASVLASMHEVDDAEELVAQGARSRSAWQDALAELRVERYRHAALTAPRLWSLLEHPRASASARIGAAYLLAGTLDDAGKARLRRFVLGCVDPRLRDELRIASSAPALDR